MANSCMALQRCGPPLLHLVRGELSRVSIAAAAIQQSQCRCVAKVASRSPHQMSFLSTHQGAALNSDNFSGRCGPSAIYQQKRHFWKTFNRIANKPDLDRIKDAGGQRACAEWLVRNGAHIRWEDEEKWERDFNTLPPDVDDNFKRLKIAEVNATGASVMCDGFVYFEGVDTIKKMRFSSCDYFGDDEATGLYRLRDCLEHLEISSCDRLTDKGVIQLGRIKSLKTLTLRNLTGVKNRDSTLRALNEALPDCEIKWLGTDQKVVQNG